MHSQDQRECLPDACKWLIKGSSCGLNSFVKSLTTDDVIVAEHSSVQLRQGVFRGQGAATAQAIHRTHFHHHWLLFWAGLFDGTALVAGGRTPRGLSVA